MQEKSFTKIKKQSPVSVIVHATNVLGENLAKILLEQGSKVVLIDKYDSKAKKLITDLREYGEVDFVDISGLEDLTKNIARIDYVFYVQAEFLLTNNSFTSKDFLEESKNLDLCLKVAQKYSSKFSLISSIFLNEKLAQPLESKSTSYSSEELQKYSETLAAEYYDKSKVNVRILRAGAILGSENNVENFKILNQLFEDSVSNEAISIAGEGLDVHYLIHLSDLIYGILKLTFSSKTSGEVISLCNNNEYTTLSVAYKLLELNPNASEIKFVPNPEKKKILHHQYIPAPNAEEYGWKQKKNLERSVKETLECKYKKHKKNWNVSVQNEKTYQEQLENIRRKKTTGKKKGHTSTVATPAGEAFSKAVGPVKNINIRESFKLKNLWKPLLLLLFLTPLFYFLIYPVFSIAASSFSIYTSSSKLAESLSSFDNDFVNEELVSVNKSVGRISRNFEKLNWFFIVIQKDDMFEETSVLLHGLETGSEGLVSLADGVQPLISYMDEFEPALSFEDGVPTTTREYTNFLKDLEKNSDKIGESSYKVSRALKAIEEVDTEVYPEFLKERIENIQELASSFNIEGFAEIAKFLPDSLGVEGRKRYLVLLQNPAELRSTGGWLTSYALIGIEGGQIRELNVEDVYNLDGELKNQKKVFPPPEEMQEVLEVNDVGLSLSNWDPNFPDSAQSASFFVKEAGEASRIDGVIAIDIFLLQDLLDEWDGIAIPGERDLITSENIYDKVFFLHKEFTPGQSQKATFLTKLADEVITRVFSSDFNENAKVFGVFSNALESKNVLLNFKNSDAQRYFSQRGWSGEISKDKYSFLPSPIEWNWGANKANLYLEREQRVRADIMNTQEVEFEYSLILKNNSTSETYPQGEYENFTRIYIPQGAKISSVEGFKNDEYSTSSEKGFKVLSGWFNIPISSTKDLSINYTLEDEDIFDVIRDDIGLSTRVFKQPGTPRDDRLRLEITYPANWAIVEQGDFDRARTRLIKDIELNQEKQIELRWEIE